MRPEISVIKKNNEISSLYSRREFFPVRHVFEHKNTQNISRLG